MTSKSEQTIVLITGANQGIGYETAKNLLLSSDRYHVIIGSRSLDNGVEAVRVLQSLNIKGTVEAVQLDVTDDKSVDAAAKHVRETYGRVDVVVNNAGIGGQIRRSGEGGVREALRQCLATNVVGAVSVTEAFLPLLLTPRPTLPTPSASRKDDRKRLIFISSTTGSLSYASDPNHVLHGSGGAIDYRTSKAALSMVIIQYDAMLRGKGVAVHGVNPGLVGTQGFHNGRSVGAKPEVGGERVACVVRGERDADLGKIVQEDGVGGGGDVLPW